MQWRKSLPIGHPLSAVVLVSRAVPQTREADDARNRQAEQAAYERGLADGEKRLSEQLLRQRAEVLELQNGILASLRQAVPWVVRQSEAGVVSLALEVARKLISDLPVSAEMVEAAVRSALAQAEESTEFQIALHADDLALLQRSNSPVLLPGPGNEAMHFHASAEVTRGGCLVETRFGVIDTRRETKLKLIQQSLNA
ncbi:MAG: FliH/SctL family protein [Verrucomicrobiota bacterium]